MPKCSMKYCIVPKCISTSRNSPDKYFFTVPRNPIVRSVWIKKCRRKDGVSEKSTVSVCEDHFDFREDLENYMEWSLTKCRPRLKRSVVPSKFACQGVVLPSAGRVSTLKRERKEILKVLLKDDEVAGGAEDPESMDDSQVIESSHTAEIPINERPEDSSEGSDPPERDIKNRGPKLKETHYRSKGIQVNILEKLKSKLVDASISPVKLRENKLLVDDIFSSDSSVCDSDSDFEAESEDFDSDSEKCNIRYNSLNVTRYYDSHESMHYLGIPSNFLFILNLLEKRINFSGQHLDKRDVVSLILRKVKCDFSFKTLGHQYGISESYAGKLFNKHIRSLSSAMRQLIRWLPPQSVYDNLPIAFWARFRETYILIDTFEIQIERPSNSFDQSESYSEYKKCNTLKYLICASPDGTIMYVSKGFLGRFTDVQIARNSDFLSSLPPNVQVMADRGFKGLETWFQDKGIKLVRPPSVGSGEILTKSKAILGKKVASLRIHIERCIGRLRNFNFLVPHSTVAHQLQNCCDDAVIIACGLINCSSPLIKI